MPITGGYILLARQLDNSDIIHEPPIVRELWLYLLRKVTHRCQAKYGVNCSRGEGFFQLNEVQDDLSWFVGYRKMKYSKPQLTKSLRRLRERNMIATTKATRGVFVKVLNYDFFQDPSNYEGNDEGNAKAMRRQQSGFTKNKNDKNERMEENTYCPTAKPSDDVDVVKKPSKTSKPKPPPYSQEFESFWSAYPKKVGKDAAWRAWRNRNGTRPDTKVLLGAVEASKLTDQWSRDNGQYIPNPSTWINQGRWNDEACAASDPYAAFLAGEVRQ